MFRLSMSNRAGVGAFFREFLRTLAGERRAFGVFETRGAIVVPVAIPQAEQEPEPSPVIAARRSGRLIDLERRAKFGQF
ncbi:hypothetical protein EDE12_107121 [Methylosinus sp. sav-2]|uniref:hypothetical protein n=1 Tax=Methylosinus sp. sav-2 TaxID=2485168 RepID=UPI00106638B4|nr:hypothetical protein [Methylosinus sp. sav-2]TDX63480.1 hypothetical protein EDE12_107121 [Methylosinus sp. sav-2]